MTTSEQLSLEQARVGDAVWELTHNYPDAVYEQVFIQDTNKLSGHSKRRQISMPNPDMLALQRGFLGRLRALNIEMPFATAAIKGGSPFKHVERHVENRYFYQIDIANAYEQVSPNLLASILNSFDPELGDFLQVKDFLQTYCMLPGGKGLVTGSPSSPDLFNIYMVPLDYILGNIAANYGLTYSRYLDDLCFSAPDNGKLTHDRIGKHKRAVIRGAILYYGFGISHHKSRLDDLQKGPINITGVQLNPSGKYQLPTRAQREAQSALAQISQELVDDGQPLSDERRGEFAGIYGVIRAYRDRSRPLGTPAEHRLSEAANKIKRTDKSRRKRFRRKY